MRWGLPIWIQNIAIAYIALWVTAPILAYGVGYRVLFVVAVFIWLVMEFLRRDNIFAYPTWPVISIVLYIGYISFMDLLWEGPEALIRHIQLYILAFFLIVHQSRRSDLSSLIPIFWIVLATMPIWGLISYDVIVSGNAHAARTIVRSSEEAKQLSVQGVGGYGLVYGTLLMLPGLLAMARSRIDQQFLPRIFRRMPKLAYALVLANIAVGSLFVISSGYSIAVITLVVITAIALLLRRYDPFRLTCLAGALVIVAMTFVPLIEALLSFIRPFADDTNYALKIHDILWSLGSDQSLGSVSDRQERYVRSLAIFLEHPVLGNLSFDEIGKHSTFLDSLAQWGVIGAIFIYTVCFLPLRYLRRTRHFGASCAMTAAVILIFGLNNAFAMAGLMLFLMFPVALQQLAGAPEERRFEGVRGQECATS